MTQKRTIHIHVMLCSFVLPFLLYGCSLRATSVKDARGGLVVELWTSDECPTPGEAVTLRATATNKGPDTLIVELKDQPVFDLIIGNPDTSRLRWSAGKTLTSNLTRLELKPGESKSIQMQWKVDASESGVVVSAQLIDDPRSPSYPIRPLMVLHVNSCSGPFGP